MLPGWLQTLLATLIGGAATGIAAAGTGADLKVIGAAAAAGAVSSVLHLNIKKNP
jgi:hypothetical protein